MNWPTEKQFLAFALGAIVFLLLASCAHEQHPRDTPQLKACQIVCERDGMEGGTVIEDADSMLCLCKKKSDPVDHSTANP